MTPTTKGANLSDVLSGTNNTAGFVNFTGIPQGLAFHYTISVPIGFKSAPASGGISMGAKNIVKPVKLGVAGGGVPVATPSAG